MVNGWNEKILDEVTNWIASGKSTKHTRNGYFCVYGSTGVIGFTNEPMYSGSKMLVARVGANAGTINRVSGEYGVSDNTLIIDFQQDVCIDFVYYTLLEKKLNRLVFGSGQPLITGKQLKELSVLLPPLPEQRRIAEVLSDTDALISALEKLIAKKRAIKQGAMQELLTGKRRLPGFDGKWEFTNIDSEFDLFAGGDLIKEFFSMSQTNKYRYPIYANALQNRGLYGYTSAPRYKGDSITITGRGDIGVAMYRETDFDAIVRLLVLTPKTINRVNSRFVTDLLNICIEFPQESTGVPQLTVPQIRNVELRLPSKTEQTAIASILSDMDTEIDALTTKLNKLRNIKQGMMSELLTGRIRLTERIE